jgi:RNA polymerase sigma-70 factor (ECF subfamily)
MAFDQDVSFSWDKLQSDRKDVADAALVELWNASRQAMYAIGIWSLHDRVRAADAVQESVCRFVQQVRRGITTTGSPRGYLIQTMRNVCRDWLRKDRSKSRFELDTPAIRSLSCHGSERPEVIVIARERRKLLQGSIQRLPEAARTAITLRFISGLSNSESAEIMDMQKNAFEVLLHRALRRLKDTVRNEDLQ